MFTQVTLFITSLLHWSIHNLPPNVSTKVVCNVTWLPCLHWALLHHIVLSQREDTTIQILRAMLKWISGHSDGHFPVYYSYYKERVIRWQLELKCFKDELTVDVFQRFEVFVCIMYRKRCVQIWYIDGPSSSKFLQPKVKNFRLYHKDGFDLVKSVCKVSWKNDWRLQDGRHSGTLIVVVEHDCDCS